MRQNMRQLAVWLFLAAVVLLLIGSPLWLRFAIAAAADFGAMLLIDAYLFDGEIYLSEWEPVIISGFMQLVPWFFVPWFVDVRWTDASEIAILAGMLNMSALVFYFRAMKTEQDAVVIAVMWNMLIVTIPFIAVGLLGEGLSFEQKIGISLIFAGAMISSWEKTFVRLMVIVLMSVAVAFSTFYTISEKHALNMLTHAGVSDTDAYWNVFLFLTLGEGVVAILASVVVLLKREGQHFRKLVTEYWRVLFLIEGLFLTFIGLTARAYSLGPASLVAPIDGLAGPFVIAFSMLVAFVLEGTRYAEKAREIESKQTKNFWWKFAGIAFIVGGAFLVGGDG